MPLLPKPYPDEVIGSIIARACWHSGLPLKRVLADIFGSSRSYNGFLIGGGFHRIGLLSGTDAEEILMCHTMFSYSTAFMSDMVRAALKSKALNPKQNQDCLSSLTKNVSHGVPYRRICTSCIKEDLATYGESYWRREHLLPGALVCIRHGIKLRLTGIALRGRAQACDTLLPHMSVHDSDKTKPTLGLLQLITKLSVQALSWKTETPDDFLSVYRQRAIELGYRLPSGDIGGVALSGAIFRFYGGRFLEESGAEMTRHSPWPSLMVRPGMTISFAPPKHVLLQAFISQGGKTPVNVSSSYRSPGQKPTDFKRLDTRLLQRLTNRVKKASVQNMRVTVKTLLQDAGSWSIYRHQRELFPKSTAFLQDFRLSSLAERQVGCRDYWRKRHPSRFGAED